MLVAQCVVHHAVGDADLLIGKEAVELSETNDTILAKIQTYSFFFYTVLVRTKDISLS